MAHEAGIEFDLFDVCDIMRRTPYIADMKPGGKYVAKDMFDVGGVSVVLKELLKGGYLHGDCLTVTGQTIAENLADTVLTPDQDVIRSISTPISTTGGVVGMKGNLAPDGAILSTDLITSSGNAGWDRAVLLALTRAESLPKDDNGKIPQREVKLTFKPKD